ncbi:MAG: hypothetical protein K940chlam3_01059, partial [Chlamydiae bacterium]|nr:hypothetical protein [Chlamydiota bacterium]
MDSTVKNEHPEVSKIWANDVANLAMNYSVDAKELTKKLDEVVQAAWAIHRASGIAE